MASKKRKKKSTEILDTAFLFVKVLAFVLLFGMVVLFAISWYKNKYKPGHQEETVVSVQENVEETTENAESNVVDLTASEAEEEVEEGPTEEELAEQARQERIASLPGTVVEVEDDGKALSFSYVGDMLLDDSYATMNRYRAVGGDVEQIFTNGSLDIMRGADILVINNEFPFTDRGTPLSGKLFTFRSKPENVKILTDIGADVAALANNHITDFGLTSLEDTLDTLDGAGIYHMGAGRNIDEATTTIYVVKGDLVVALLNATQLERLPVPDTAGATENSAGTFRCYDSARLEEEIKKAKEYADYAVVYVHWGAEREVNLHAYETSQDDLYVDAGADLIVGAHPHILQQVGYVKGVPVVYSLGNYWFSSASTDTGILSFDVSDEGVENLKFNPCVSEHCVVRLSDGNEKKRIIDYLNSLSDTAVIDDEGYISSK